MGQNQLRLNFLNYLFFLKLNYKIFSLYILPVIYLLMNYIVVLV